jgi:hypothetical protein
LKRIHLSPRADLSCEVNCSLAARDVSIRFPLPNLFRPLRVVAASWHRLVIVPYCRGCWRCQEWQVCTRVTPCGAKRIARGPSRGAVCTASPPASQSEVQTSSFLFCFLFPAPRQSDVVRTGSHGAVEVLFRRCVKGGPSSTPCHSAIRRSTSFQCLLISFLLNQLEITKDIKPEPRFRPSPFCANPHETCAFCTYPQKNAFFPVFLQFRPCVPFPRSL